MIGFNSLGLLGRLGNQMFQYASLKGIANNNNYQYCIPPSANVDQWKDHQLFNCFALKNLSKLNIQYINTERPVVHEASFGFDEKLFNECPSWVSLVGFFQSEKYFKHIEKEIREDFTFVDSILIPCQEAISELKNPVSLHIRRTDYLTNPNHNCLPLSYYEKALDRFDDGTVIIFTDDPKWVYDQELFSSDRFIVSEGQSNYMDLCLMSLCRGHIIANSSFSWWGAWLSNSQNIIAPSDWFTGSSNAHLDTKDLIPSEWELL